MLLGPEHVEQVIARAPELRIAVVGDLFLDRYLDIDGTLTEPSIETGLDAYQIVSVRSIPGAAGTIVNNLVALGVGTVAPISLIGDDGEGYELLQALRTLPGVVLDGVAQSQTRRTPTYTKPMLARAGEPPRELNRLDIHPRSPLPAEGEREVLARIAALVPECDAVALLDQVTLPECGVVTSGVRRVLAERAIPLLADSRFRISQFKGVMLKPNEQEAMAAIPDASTAEEAALRLAARAGQPVFCTRGDRGILVAQPDGMAFAVPSFSVNGPLDPVGAGDSTTAGILCALASGLSLVQAAAFGCLVASITVSKLGTTGTASPDELRAKIRE